MVGDQTLMDEIRPSSSDSSTCDWYDLNLQTAFNNHHLNRGRHPFKHLSLL